MSKISSGETKNTLYCSFCGKSQHEVRKLIAGPTVFICDECVELWRAELFLVARSARLGMGVASALYWPFRHRPIAVSPTRLSRAELNLAWL